LERDPPTSPVGGSDPDGLSVSLRPLFFWRVRKRPIPRKLIAGHAICMRGR